MKKIGILGTGVVGSTLGSKLVSLGYEVKMGSRSSGNQKAQAWTSNNGNRASAGTFAEAVQFGDIIFICTKGVITLEMLQIAGVDNFNGKTVIDVTNPLDFTNGMPPILIPSLSNTNSLGEEVQRVLTSANVVKTLNIVNCEVMADPSKSGGEPTMFVSGNSKEAKEEVISILYQFGWKDIIDLGDISTCRGPEMMLPIWLRTWQATGNGHIGFKIIR